MPAHDPFDAVAPPSALPRAPGWRDRLRALAARRRGVVAGGPVTIGRRVRFDVSPGARVRIGAGASVGDGCRFHVRAGEVRIGAGAVLGDRCVVTVHAGAAIGDRCVLADEVVLVDFAHRFDDADRPTRAQGVEAAPVTVGDGARIGSGAVLLRGVTIGAGAKVGAHAVVTRDVAPGAAVEGVPAAQAGATPPRAPRAPGAGAPR